MEEYKLSQDILALMFCQDPLLRDMAANLVNKLDVDKFNSVLKRLSEDSREAIEFYLKYAGTYEDCGQIRHFEMLKNSGLFSRFKNHDILELAKRFEIQIIDPEKNKVIRDSFNKNIIMLIVEGELTTSSSKPEILVAGKLISLKEKFAPAENIEFDNHCKALIMMMKETSLQELIFDNENTFFPVTELMNEPSKI
jgi:hypothetical protein